jgi:glucokinase
MVGKKMKSGKVEHTILAGDIGGTKTNLGVFSPGDRRPLPIVVESFPSQESSDLATIIERFLKKHPVVVHSACFGIAGPVVQGKSKPTNLPWEVSEVSLKRRFGWQHVHLLNDLAATAEMIPLLTRREQFALNPAKPPRNQNLALVAPGTGLGGGIPPKTLPALKGDPFMKAFTNKGRFEDLMKRIPVRVILNDKAALIGAAQSCFAWSAT